MSSTMSVNSYGTLSQSLGYYRSKLDNIEAHIKDHYQIVEQQKLNAEDYFNSQRQLSNIKQEIAELQKTISDGHTSIYDERQQIINYRKTIDTLKATKLKKQSQINELLPLLCSTEQEKIYFKDSRPEKIRYPLSQITQPIDPGLSLQRLPIAQKATQINKHVGPITSKPKNVLRAIYMPIEQSNMMQSEVEMMKAQIEEQKMFFEKQIMALRDDKIVREEEMRLKSVDYEEKISQAQEFLKRQEELNYNISKQYFDLKYYSKQYEEKLINEKQVLKGENEECRAKFKYTLETTNKEISALEREIGRKTNLVYKNMRTEMEKKDESAMLVKYEYEKIQSSFVENIRELEEKIRSKENEYELYQTKRTVAMESFGRDMNNLKRRVKLYDEYIKTLQKNKESVSTPKDIADVKSLAEQADNLEKMLAAIRSKGYKDTPAK